MHLTLLRYCKNLSLVIFCAFVVESFATNTEVDDNTPQRIVIAAQERCPYVCDPDSDYPGYLVELTQRVFDLYGIDVKYEVMPFDEAVLYAKKGWANAVVSDGTDITHFLTTTIPQVYGSISAFVVANSNWVFSDMRSLNGLVITTTSGTPLGNTINSYLGLEYPKNPSRFLIQSEDDRYLQAVVNLILGKSDVYFEDEIVLEQYLLKKPDLYKQIKKSSTINQAPIGIFVAFTKDTKLSQKYVNLLEEGMQNLAISGDISTLKSKYNIHSE